MIKIPVYRRRVMNTTLIKRTVAAIGLTCLLSGGLVLTAATPASAFPDPGPPTSAARPTQTVERRIEVPVPVANPSKTPSQFYISPGTGPVGERFLPHRTVQELEKVIATRSQFYISAGTGPVGERFLPHRTVQELEKVIATRSQFYISAGTGPVGERVVAFKIDRDCPLRRIDRQLLRCDNLTGSGVPAPLSIPEL